MVRALLSLICCTMRELERMSINPWRQPHELNFNLQSYLPYSVSHLITQGCGQVEELVCSRMKYSRLYVILLHLVLSAKSEYNFWPGLMALAPHTAPQPNLPPTNPIHNPKHTHLTLCSVLIRHICIAVDWCALKQVHERYLHSDIVTIVADISQSVEEVQTKQ